VALRERAALGILAGQAHRMAFLQQRAERQRLAGRPVDALAGLDRLGAVVEEARMVRWTLKPSGTSVSLRPISRSVFESHAGDAAARILFLVGRRMPVQRAVEPVGLVRLVGRRRLELGSSSRARQSAALPRPRLGHHAFATSRLA
jgi:hypothetical protein